MQLTYVSTDINFSHLLKKHLQGYKICTNTQNKISLKLWNVFLTSVQVAGLYWAMLCLHAWLNTSGKHECVINCQDRSAGLFSWLIWCKGTYSVYCTSAQTLQRDASLHFLGSSRFTVTLKMNPFSYRTFGPFVSSFFFFTKPHPHISVYMWACFRSKSVSVSRRSVQASCQKVQVTLKNPSCCQTSKTSSFFTFEILIIIPEGKLLEQAVL